MQNSILTIEISGSIMSLKREIERNKKMKERLKAGAEMLVEDQRVLYSLMYIGLKRAIGNLRRPETPAEVYGPEPVSSPARQENIDTVYSAAT